MSSPVTPPTLGARLHEIKQELEEAAVRSLLTDIAPELVAVSKQQPLARIEEALEAGQRCFGENRVQEAEGRWPGLRERFPDVTLHMIGPLQTNKLKEAVQLFDVIETVDREKMASKLAALFKERENYPDWRMQRCFIQVNTGEEEQKAGIAPREADAFIPWCRDELGLPVVGLMCIPPAGQTPAPHFALLHEMARRHGLAQLSMGMSGDYLEAVAFGATHVRIGTAVFGERTPHAAT